MYLAGQFYTVFPSDHTNLTAAQITLFLFCLLPRGYNGDWNEMNLVQQFTRYKVLFVCTYDQPGEKRRSKTASCIKSSHSSFIHPSPAKKLPCSRNRRGIWRYAKRWIIDSWMYRNDWVKTENCPVFLIYQRMNHSVTRLSTGGCEEVTVFSPSGRSRNRPIVHWYASTSPCTAPFLQAGRRSAWSRLRCHSQIYGRISFSSQTKQRPILHVHTVAQTHEFHIVGKRLLGHERLLWTYNLVI